MTTRAITAPDVPAPAGPYSHAVEASGRFVFLAGQGPFRPDGSLPEGFTAQAEQTLRNLAAVAAAAGGSLRDAVRVGVYLRSMDDFAELNRVYERNFEAPFPARTTIHSQLPGFDIEIDAVLVL